jgi:hypothetical protein
METLTQLEKMLDPNTFIGHTSAHYTEANPPSTLTPCVNDTNIGNIRQ